ncbi:MAG TPA: endolytic transglycosylase MltG [Candidatus Paceibacterota bacterium]|nr:endolytic transglycosylase MltG [Candidatus Paceibacterota bacterium]
MQRFFSSRRSLVICAALLALFIAFFHTPRAFVPETLVSIPAGTPFSEAARLLKESGVITSAPLLRIAMLAGGGAEAMKAGDYLFERPEGTLSVARRLANGRYDLVTVRVLLPEGSTSKDMGRLLAEKLPHIDADVFGREARGFEGYLFPDTYFFLPTATSGEVIGVLRTTFDEKARGILSDESTFSAADVVIMASILEEEAKTPEDKHIVAGILWKRVHEGMRLQVDAPFVYLLGKASHELTQEDLVLDSPYNTYLYEGLPPAPISNPGLESLEAALRPMETPYWFYLSDSEGMIHYAETFEEHVANKQRYIP